MYFFIRIISAFLISSSAFAQNEPCDTVYEFPQKEASFKNGSIDVLHFFTDSLLPIIYDADSGDFPPTSFKMVLIINDNDEVVSISQIKGDYSEGTKNKILEKLQEENGWTSGEFNGQKVCSKFYFVVGCIIWN